MITHLDAINISTLKHRALKSGEKGWKSRHVLSILERDKYKCVICNRSKDLTMAHIVPTKKKRSASSYTLDKCRTLCVECHIKVDHGIVNTINYIYY